MKLRRLTVFYLVLGLALVAMSGCSATKALVDKVTPGKKDLKKRVMVFPLIDHAGFDKASEEQINREFLDRLAQSSDLLLLDPFESGPRSTKGISMRFGIELAPEAVARAREMGLNAAVIGIIQPFEVTTQRTGVWPFRSTKADYEISVAVSIVDITDTTLLFSEQESRNKRVPADEVDERTVRDLREEAMEKQMPKIIKDLAKDVIQALRHEPWRGLLTEAADGRLKISAGADVGLEPGHRFDVFSLGEIITAKGGRQVAMVGEKVGQIRAETVGEVLSTAVPVTEGNYQAGQIIVSRP